MSHELPRYGDGRLNDVALALATCGQRAAEYLQQAPVLALLMPTKFRGIATYGDVDRFGQLVAAGPSLRDVLASASATVPLRKLRADTIKVKHHEVIGLLATLDNSTLSQVIPRDPERQHQWLTDLHEFATYARKRGRVLHFRWAALQLSRDRNHVREVADLATKGDRPFNERWSWAQAVAAAQEWHLRLARERRANRPDAPPPPDPFEVICRSKLPDLAEQEGVVFRVLRTRSALREEGSVMHHCVSSYAGDVKRGRCAIVSAQRDGERATVEIMKGEVVQIKGYCNAAPSLALRQAAAMYALRHGGAAA